MCRWIAYRGVTTALEHYVTEPSHSLISQSIQALESTAGTNGDGFGLGWYGNHPEPGLYREVRPAWSDENLRYLCRHLQSHLYFAHVRAATGTPITRQNCHPFACGKWMFMHNGFIGSWSRLRRQVEGFIPDELYPARIGTTDSEAVFLAILGASMDDPVAAAESVLARLTALVNETSPPDRLRFTAALACRPPAGPIEQDAAHQGSGYCEEVGAMLPVQLLGVHKTQIDLVNQVRALQAMAWALVLQQARGHAAQLAVDAGSQLLERFRIAFGPRSQKLRGIGAG